MLHTAVLITNPLHNGRYGSARGNVAPVLYKSGTQNAPCAFEGRPPTGTNALLCSTYTNSHQKEGLGHPAACTIRKVPDG